MLALCCLFVLSNLAVSSFSHAAIPSSLVSNQNYVPFYLADDLSNPHIKRQPKKTWRMRWSTFGGCVAYVAKQERFNGHAGNGVGMINALLSTKRYHNVSCREHQYGDIISYSGGRHGLGHTARWEGDCWKYDVKCLPDHISGFHEIGCVRRNDQGQIAKR
jgi:hypothetical protein